ncbi:MAG: glycosyltransferase [Lachnospira sp.]|nr:glycosyltransferase [Lachnospira sp.]
MKNIRVLIIITTGFVSHGGLTTVMMNYYRNMNRDNLAVDFASDSSPEDELLSELKANNSRYYRLPNRKKNLIQYIHGLKKVIAANKYDIVHINGNSSTMFFDLLPAVICGVSSRIVQVHSTTNEHPFLNKILRPFMNRLATTRVAVSEEAGEYLYSPYKFVVLNNAIDTDKYAYNAEYRADCRKELQIEKNEFVIGTVGAHSKGKNHLFLCELLNRLDRKKFKLLMLGEGPEQGTIVEYIKNHNMEDRVILPGRRMDVERYLSAMDIFLFPSLWEGFGLSLLEAEASGLNCICSDQIPKQVQMSNCKALPLSSMTEWCESVNAISKNTSSQQREEKSRKVRAEIRNHGLDIKKEADSLRSLYIKSLIKQ